MDQWLLQFAQLFKESTGIDLERHSDLNTVGIDKVNLVRGGARWSESPREGGGRGQGWELAEEGEDRGGSCAERRRLCVTSASFACMLGLTGGKSNVQATEEAVTSDQAVPLFREAMGKFQEQVGIGFYNWASAHMSIAAKHLADILRGGEQRLHLPPPALLYVLSGCSRRPGRVALPLPPV